MHAPVWALTALGAGGSPSSGCSAGAARAAHPGYSSPPVVGVPPGLEPELRQLLAENRKIEAIKRLRQVTRSSLADAKDMVERL